MENSEHNKLGAFLGEVANWDWEAFCRAENDPQYTSNQALIFALVRACVMQKMAAIQLALGRLDGKLKTPVRIETPKVYYLFPRATVDKPVEYGDKPGIVGKLEGVAIAEEKNLLTGEIIEHKSSSENPDEPDLKELTLRQTITRMSDYPREVPDAIIAFAEATQIWLQGNGPEPEEKPMVKSVVAAHLLRMAQNRNIDALNEVFDQIDGKLVETIQLLGEDIYITSYSLTAPGGAYLNADGVLQVEASAAQDLWAQKLKGGKNGG